MIIRFDGYSHGAAKFVNIDRIIHFEQIGFNWFHGTEIHMDDGSKIRVGHWPEDVKNRIAAGKAQQGGVE